MQKCVWDFTKEMPSDHEFEAFHRVQDNPEIMNAFHAHEHYEFYLYIKGDVDIAVEEKLYTPQPYDLFIFPPGIMHRWVDKPGLKRLDRIYVYASRSCLESMSTEEYPMMEIVGSAMSRHNYSVCLGAQTGTAIAHQADEIINHAMLSDPADRMLNRCRMQMLLVSICRMLDAAEDEAHTVPNRMRDVITYINTHLTEPITQDMLAEKFFISKFHLSRMFKEHANLSIHQYIIIKRIIYAQQMIREGTSLDEAARNSGFNDYAGFYRAFVKHTGVTPSAFAKSGHSRAEQKLD